MEEEAEVAEEDGLAGEEAHDVAAVFQLLDPQRAGISQQVLEQTLKATGLVSDIEAEQQATEAAQQSESVDLGIFHTCLNACVLSATKSILEQLSIKSDGKQARATPTVGTALL